MKKILIGIILVLLIGGASIFYFNEKNRNYEEGLKQEYTVLIKNKDYENAIKKIDLYLKEKPNDSEARIEKTNLETYLYSKKEFDKGNYSSANLSIEKIIDYKNSRIEGEISSLKEELKPKLKEAKLFYDKTKKISDLISKNEFDKAKKEINVLEKERLTEYEKSEIEGLNYKFKKTKKEYDKALEDKKKAEEKKKKDEKKITIGEAVEKLGNIKKINDFENAGKKIIYTPEEGEVNKEKGYKIEVKASKDGKEEALGNYFVSESGKLYEESEVSNDYKLIKE